MIVLIGLVILVAAVVLGVAGVLTNGGGRPLTDQFAVFGYHVTGSTGVLFLYGIVVGAVGVLGLSLLLAGARRTARRGRLARRELKQSRLETAAANQDRSELADARSGETADTTADGRAARGASPDGAERGDRPVGRIRAFGRGQAEPRPVGSSHSGHGG